MKLYRAGSICSSMRSIMPARLMRAVVLNLLLVRFAQDSGDILASLDTLFDGNNDGVARAAIFLMCDDEAGARLDHACFHADNRSSAWVQGVTSFDHNLLQSGDVDGTARPQLPALCFFMDLKVTARHVKV